MVSHPAEILLGTTVTLKNLILSDAFYHVLFFVVGSVDSEPISHQMVGINVMNPACII